MNIDIKTNSDVISEFFTEVAQRQIPYASLRTTQDLAYQIRTDVLGEMERSFHKPTPNFTLRSIEVIKYKNLEDPHTWVGLKMDAPWQKALAHQFTGGMRRYKRMEGAFERVGILPKGYMMIPAEGCPMDAYDNPKRSFINQMLAYFSAFGEQGYKANMTVKTRKTFLKGVNAKSGAENEFFTVSGGWANGKKSSLPPGIWRRIKFGAIGETRTIPIFLFVRVGAYRRMVHLPEIAKEVVSTMGIQTFAMHLRRAMANDKRFMAAMRRV